MSRHALPRPPAQQLPADGLHTPAQAARALDVPTHVITRWARAGKIAHAAELPAPVPGGVQRFYTLTELRPHADRYHRRRRGRGVRPALAIIDELA